MLVLDFFSHLVKTRKCMFFDLIKHKIHTFFNSQSALLFYCFFLFINCIYLLLFNCNIHKLFLLIFFHCFTIPIVTHVHVSFLLPGRFSVRDGLNLLLSCRRNKQRPKKKRTEGQIGPMTLMRGADRTSKGPSGSKRLFPTKKRPH